MVYQKNNWSSFRCASVWHSVNEFNNVSIPKIVWSTSKNFGAGTTVICITMGSQPSPGLLHFHGWVVFLTKPLVICPSSFSTGFNEELNTLAT